ncbi:GAF domain-containing protein [Mycolicibacterium iranicum]|uniref:GAF domain-containing protein n=2 Tax=Mycolicibacterium iranicum TaxID=912594 RepID=A0ABT4HFG5_MYCIR|nr:GAF domain-containing protein [Mycolicibacterium iranicum]MCZ0728591.1 GAF domain-containing protein [Mycolicibacterium iranicum]
MISLPGFNAWLNNMVEEQAAKAEQTPDEYVAQAVATQLMADVTRHKEDHRELLAHLSDADIKVAEQSAGPQSVVADPERLQALYATGLLDAPREKIYDHIADMAASALAAPGAAISLVDLDRQFFVSMHGSPAEAPEERQTSIDRSVCQYAVASGQPLVIPDAREDPVLKYNPAVTDGTVVAYLGIPLINSGNHAIGTLCVWDTSPRQWTSGHVMTLRDLAQLATDRMFNR